jgi:hypothetical protein
MLETKYLVKNLIDQLNMEKCLQNSFKNYHTHGIYYINLFRDLDLTIKLYFIMPGKVAHNPEGFLVAPHKHAYNFSTQVLFGKMRHVVFEEKDYGDKNNWYKYLYESYKKPEERLQLLNSTTLEVASDLIYTSGQSYFVDTDVTHSLVVPDLNEMTCLMLTQFADTQLNGTDFYSTSPTPPSFENIYEQFIENEVVDLLNILKKELKI